jgi:hypothetical protein
MTRPADERVARWLVDLGTALDTAASLARRGEQAFRSDPALPLAFEALSNRVGDLSKRLATADPVRFSEPIGRKQHATATSSCITAAESTPRRYG